LIPSTDEQVSIATIRKREEGSEKMASEDELTSEVSRQSPAIYSVGELTIYVYSVRISAGRIMFSHGLFAYETPIFQ